MKYLIHACPERMGYVERFLYPSLREQGIGAAEIEIANDEAGRGNLFAFFDSLRICGREPGGVWHMQDDVLICRDFAERTRALDDGLVCGFCCRNFETGLQFTGNVRAVSMWYSFQCIRIPNELAKECAAWFFTDAVHRPAFQSQVTDRKHDDWFFRNFMLERHPDMRVTNLTPCLVEHIDWLIGGTVVNPQRSLKLNRAAFFPDEVLVKELEAKLSNQ